LASARYNADPRAGSAELAGADAADQGPLLGAGERQDGPDGVLGVAHRDLVGQLGGLDAVTIAAVVIAAALTPGDVGQVSRLEPPEGSPWLAKMP
jgi:hypothetical protein